MKIHYLAEYLRNPTHPISVQLVGVGGTGSNVLRGLAYMHQSMLGLGSMGLSVSVFDDDLVSDINVKRQLFYEADIGLNKASVLVSRYNRSFGTKWNAYPVQYQNSAYRNEFCNILLTCVDTGQARMDIWNTIKNQSFNGMEPYDKRFYWMDFGNSKDTGQIILGSWYTTQPLPVDKPEIVEHVCRLKNICELYPEIATYDNMEEQGPSCSTQQALNRQDLFINPIIADLGLSMLWQFLKYFNTPFQGIFYNGKTFNTNPLTIQ